MPPGIPSATAIAVVGHEADTKQGADSDHRHCRQPWLPLLRLLAPSGSSRAWAQRVARHRGGGGTMNAAAPRQ